jgi:putative spermidine/putrescine transport system substrate-binding protein
MKTKLRRLIATAAILGSAAASIMICAGAEAQDKGTVVIASFGGKYQDGLRQAIFKPFEEATGIKVIEVSGISLAKIKAMEQTGDVEWDVFECVPTEYLVLSHQGMLEKIDYGQIDPQVLAQLDDRAKQPYGINFLSFTQVIAYNTHKYSKEHHPHTWAEVWDVQKFPGARIFPAGDYEIEPFEPALLADGVAPDKLYPIDFDRAFKSLAKIKPSVIKWVNSSSAVPQALVDGEADIGLAAAARIIQLKDEGAPVDFDWNQGLITSDYWVILKGAKNYKNAIKFIEFASQGKPAAELVKILPFGPTPHTAFQYLTPEQQAKLPTAPDNIKQEIWLNPEWWSQTDASGTTNLEKSHTLWNNWITAQ